jgi:signal transduction histidine kinase
MKSPTWPALGPLRRDPWLLATGAAGLAFALLYALPLLQTEAMTRFRDEASFLVLTGLAVGSMAYRLRRVAQRGERRAWTLFLVALAIWHCEEWIELLVPQSKVSGPLSVLNDLLFLFVYLAFVLGLDEWAADFRPRDSARLARRMNLLGALVLGSALTVYFVSIPRRMAPADYAAGLPSAHLYLALDLLTTARFFAVWAALPAGRARRLVGLLVGMFALWLATDLGQTLALHGITDVGRQTWFDAVWYASFLPLLLAARLRDLDWPSEPRLERDTDEDFELQAPLAISPFPLYAAALPFLHLLAESMGWSDPALARVRGVVVLAATALLAGLGVVYELGSSRIHARLRGEYRIAEEQLARAQKLEAVGRLAAGVAHDFNNLLTVVIGRTDMLLAAERDAAASGRYLAEIRQAATRAADLTAQLLAVGRRQRTERSVCALPDLLARLAPLARDLAGPARELELAVAAGTPAIAVDPQQFERMLLNLVQNACDASAAGRPVRIDAETRHLARPLATHDGEIPSGDWVVVAVSDRGEGMDEATLGRAFEPFFTTKPVGKGSGLGLPTVVGLVRQNEGHLLAASRLGRGTRIELFFAPAPTPVASRA